jgi:cation transport regulator ChaC
VYLWHDTSCAVRRPGLVATLVSDEALAALDMGLPQPSRTCGVVYEVPPEHVSTLTAVIYQPPHSSLGAVCAERS